MQKERKISCFLFKLFYVILYEHIQLCIVIRSACSAQINKSGKRYVRKQLRVSFVFLWSMLCFFCILHLCLWVCLLRIELFPLLQLQWLQFSFCCCQHFLLSSVPVCCVFKDVFLFCFCSNEITFHGRENWKTLAQHLTFYPVACQWKHYYVKWCWWLPLSLNNNNNNEHMKISIVNFVDFFFPCLISSNRKNPVCG